ncbi:hypothetical protein K449DRAFT_229703 [Hypoxylon sp. EC38]|nr:hypothetical protein K449DRAFT_229703 [Hypoxylon sp. EC38]
MPLHIAANWPRGLAILIEHGGKAIQAIVNTRDRWNMTVLDYAIELGQVDSVKLVCDVRTCLRSEYISRFELVKHRIPHERIASVLVSALSQERRELLLFALSELPREDIDGFGLQTDVLLDQKAFDVIAALQQRGITVRLPLKG